MRAAGENGSQLDVIDATSADLPGFLKGVDRLADDGIVSQDLPHGRAREKRCGWQEAEEASRLTAQAAVRLAGV